MLTLVESTFRSSVKMEEQDFLQRRLSALKSEHRTLESEIKTLESSPGLNQLKLQRLKRRKLALKDQIKHLESDMHPDIIA